MAYQVNIIVHQLEQARWEVVNFRDAGARTIQLSYHTGDHYASVRARDGSLPPQPATHAVPGGSDGTFAAALLSAATFDDASLFEPGDEPTGQERIVMDSTGASLEEARNALLDNFCDTDSAVSYLLMLKFSLEVCFFFVFFFFCCL